MEGYPETDRPLCPFCGQVNEKRGRFCIHCGKVRSERRRSRLAKPLILAGLALTGFGLFAFFLIRSPESREVGRVNGESISREEYSKRIARAKKFYEYRYGQDIFQGEPGRGNLNRVKSETLDEMVNEKILLQEAKVAGYTSAPEEEITKELEAIKKKNSLSEADLTTIFGGNIDDFKEELRTGWVISQFVEKVVVKGNPGNGNQLFSQWFTQVKARSKIETYEKFEPVSVSAGGASCCGIGGGCGGGGRAQVLDPKIEQEAKAKGLEYYEKKTQKKGTSARVTNFGCHVQVDIIEDDKVVVSLTYREGEVQEI